jgi:hypothetical protein
MARYNSVTQTNSITATTIITSPFAGPYSVITGAGGYTITVPDPVLFPAQQLTFFNNSSAACTLTTPQGNFKGPGAPGSLSTYSMVAGSEAVIISDGAGYIIETAEGGPLVATTATFSGAVTMSPANANVTISPTGAGTVTIAPATTGSLNNVTIGASTAAAGTFTNLTVSGTISGSGFSGLFVSPGAIGSTTPNSGTFTTLTASGTTTLQQITEKTVDLASPGGSQSPSFANGTTFYVTGMSGNFTLNLTSVPTTNSRTIVVTLFLIQGGTPYYCNTFQIDGATQSIKWPGAVTPTVVASRTDIQTFTLVRTSVSTWIVMSQLSTFA